VEWALIPMSLYRHVASKEELHDVMIDATAELGATVTNDWRAGLTAWIANLMAIYRRILDPPGAPDQATTRAGPT
jgi:AcrR family transcriptional regulator